MQNILFKITKFTLCLLLTFHGIADCQTPIRTTSELLQDKEAMDSIMSIDILNDMVKLGTTQDSKLNIQSNCTTKEYGITPILVYIIQPIEFNYGRLFPSKGIWKVRYKFDRCGESKIYNALFTASNDREKPKCDMLLPGTTNASQLLIKDALTSALTNVHLQAIKTGDKKCEDVNVFDMRVSEGFHDVTEGDKTFKGVWEEIWTFKCCDKMVDVAITFIPNADPGGASFICRSTSDKKPQISSILSVNQPIKPRTGGAQ